MTIVRRLARLSGDVRGATSVEYGLILAMVFLAMVGAVAALGTEDTSLWGQVEDRAVTAMKGES